jgi:DNA polymerase III delta prime subunit
LTSDEPPNIQNNAPNQGAQGIFNAPVSFHYAAPAPETERERRNRTVMLQKVHDFWVKGVLENSLHKAALIDLGMAYQPDAVAYPWEMVVERPDATPQSLPQGTPIARVFDELRGELLILGSPGSGKTTMLLELARTLVERAQQEETHPIPVVFNLSSWAEQRPPLADWLVEELNARYDVPRKVGQAWIDHDQMLPLLDGLDEVRQDARDACVAAINAYRQEHGMVGMVVCSRVADYAALTAKLKLRGAIMVQPLTDEQIDSYLAQAGDQLVAVQTPLNEDAEMRELAETPLMLSIMSLAYQGMPPDALPEHVSLDTRRRHLFDTYVERMLKRRGGSKRYTPEQTRHWLSWLAGRMAEHEQTVFYLEEMQPDGLARQRWLYWLGYGLGYGLVFGLLGALGYGLGYGLLGGLLGGLVFGLVFGLLGGLDYIKPVERVRWSRRKVKARGVLGIGLRVGLGIGLLGALANELRDGLFFGLFFGLLGALSHGLVDGLETGELGHKTMPNQAIRRSPRSAIVAGLVFGLVGGLVFGLVSVLVFGLFFGLAGVLSYGLVRVLVGGMLCGFVGGMFGGLVGGHAVIQHYALRLVLSLNNHVPLNYVRFLDHAAERILLRKVGGGYIFVHRMLLEYFASLEEEKQRKNDTPGAP